MFRYLIAICLCILFVPAVDAGPLANIRAKIKAVLHHSPTPAPGVTADKPECQSCKEHSVLKRRTTPTAPTAPAEVAPKTAAKGTVFIRADKKCQCQNGQPCICGPNCQCGRAK